MTPSYVCCSFGQYVANGSLPVIPVTRSTSDAVVTNEANKAFNLTRRMRKHSTFKLTQNIKSFRQAAGQQVGRQVACRCRQVDR